MSAHIPVQEGLAGITSLLEYRLDTGAPLRALTHTLLRGPSSLTEGERELIAMVVSQRNECHFCVATHSATAELLLVDPATINAVKHDIDGAPVSRKMKTLLHIASKVQRSGLEVTTEDVDAARAEGATDTEIHDTVLIAALFSLHNRYVDGLAAVVPDDPEYYRTIARRLVHRGYLRPEGGFPRASMATLST